MYISFTASIGEATLEGAVGPNYSYKPSYIDRRDLLFPIGTGFSELSISFPFTRLFLPSPYVSLSYFILHVPMHKCLGKHVCMSSRFPIAVLSSILLFFEKLDCPGLCPSQLFFYYRSAHLFILKKIHFSTLRTSTFS